MEDTAYTPFLTPQMIEEQAWQDVLRYQQQRGGKLKFPLYPDEVMQTLWNVEVRYEDVVVDGSGKSVLACFLPTNRVVLLNTRTRANEGQVSYSLAHEAGHVSLHEFLSRLGNEPAFCSPSPLSVERREGVLEMHADQYASAFLMPKHAVTEALANCETDRRGLDLARFGKPLCALFGVSHQALEIRLANLGIKTHGGFYKTGHRSTSARTRELDAMEEERASWSLYDAR